MFPESVGFARLITVSMCESYGFEKKRYKWFYKCANPNGFEAFQLLIRIISRLLILNGIIGFMSQV